jgi:hypothetical protein
MSIRISNHRKSNILQILIILMRKHWNLFNVGFTIQKANISIQKGSSLLILPNSCLKLLFHMFTNNHSQNSSHILKAHLINMTKLKGFYPISFHFQQCPPWRPPLSKSVVAGTTKQKNEAVAFNELREEYLKAPMTEKLVKLNQIAAQIDLSSKGIEVSQKMGTAPKEPSKQYLENYQKVAPEANVETVVQRAVDQNWFTDPKYLGSSEKAILFRI